MLITIYDLMEMFENDDEVSFGTWDANVNEGYDSLKKGLVQNKNSFACKKYSQIIIYELTDVRMYMQLKLNQCF